MLNQKRFNRLTGIISTEPLYAYHALYDLDNYLDGSPAEMIERRQWITMLADFRPYPDVLLKLAQVQALQGDKQQAQYTMTLALASFPTYAREFIDNLADGPNSWQPLRMMASDAYDRLPARYRQ